jgi:hypothetical protein
MFFHPMAIMQLLQSAECLSSTLDCAMIQAACAHLAAQMNAWESHEAYAPWLATLKLLAAPVQVPPLGSASRSNQLTI